MKKVTMPERRQTARLQDMLRALVEQMAQGEAPNGDAPGHFHDRAGIWDSDNGELAGKPCAWCRLWKEARALIEQKSTGENNV